MSAPLPTHLRNAVIRTLLIVASLAMCFVLVRIYQIKQEVDLIAGQLSLEHGSQTTLIYDSKDRVISALFKEHRMPVMLEQMSEPLQKAVLVAEDRRFYEHNGIDLRRVSAAMIANLRRGRIAQGASTITQQFVRGNVLDRSRTYSRKFREAWLSHRLEEKFGKNAILQAYLNHVYFGDGYYGVQAASLGYFGKPASEISAVEGATLASLINRPSGWTIRKTPLRIRARRDWVLREMHKAGYLDAGTYGKSIATPVASTLAGDAMRVETDPVSAAVGPYFVNAVREMLFERLGVERTLTGGLRVYTTLDSDVQKFAEDSVSKRLADSINGAGRAHRCRRRWLRSNPRRVTSEPWSADGITRRARTTARSMRSVSPDRRSSPSSLRPRSKRASRRAPPSTASTATSRPRRAPTCPVASTRSNRRRCDRRSCIRAIAPPSICFSGSG